MKKDKKQVLSFKSSTDFSEKFVYASLELILYFLVLGMPEIVRFENRIFLQNGLGCVGV